MSYLQTHNTTQCWVYSWMLHHQFETNHKLHTIHCLGNLPGQHVRPNDLLKLTYGFCGDQARIHPLNWQNLTHSCPNCDKSQQSHHNVAETQSIHLRLCAYHSKRLITVNRLRRFHKGPSDDLHSQPGESSHVVYSDSVTTLVCQVTCSS